jgi:hypothetical protein
MTFEVVGRQEEFDSISAFLDEVRDGPSALVLVGEAGIGKSTLWRAGVEQARSRGLRVLSPVVQSGTNASFNIVGWVGFWITGYHAQGNSGVVYGHFDRYIAQGLQAVDPNSQPDLGARTIQLTR